MTEMIITAFSMIALIDLRQSIPEIARMALQKCRRAGAALSKKFFLEGHMTGLRSIYFTSLKYDFSFLYFLVLLNIYIYALGL